MCPFQELGHECHATNDALGLAMMPPDENIKRVRYGRGMFAVLASRDFIGGLYFLSFNFTINHLKPLL